MYMSKTLIIKNEDVKQVLIGAPKGHKHVRVYIKLKNGTAMFFQEATIANILRAYITVKTHPNIRAQELTMKTLTVESRREGYAAHQLLETSRNAENIEDALQDLLEKTPT
mgnify:CR=1 FL=1